MHPIHDQELIEKHLLGKLNSEEDILFEERMKDVLFADELRLYKDIKKASTDLGRSQVKKEFIAWDAEEQIQHKTPVISWKWSKVAAAVLFLVTLGVLAIYLIPSTTPTQLYLEYYEPYPNLIDPVQKGEIEEDVSLSQVYELSDYHQVKNMTPNDSLETFYLALSHLALNEFETAINDLKPIAHNPSHRFHAAAQWYLALAYLRIDPNQSRALLRIISQATDHDFSAMANDLLIKLR
jgi:hypothetical protein